MRKSKKTLKTAAATAVFLFAALLTTHANEVSRDFNFYFDGGKNVDHLSELIENLQTTTRADVPNIRPVAARIEVVDEDSEVFEDVCNAARLELNQKAELADIAGINGEFKRYLKQYPDKRIALIDEVGIELKGAYARDILNVADHPLDVSFNASIEGKSIVVRRLDGVRYCEELLTIADLRKVKTVLPVNSRRISKMKPGEIWKFPIVMRVGLGGSIGTAYDLVSVSLSLGASKEKKPSVTLYKMDDKTLRLRVRLDQATIEGAGISTQAVTISAGDIGRLEVENVLTKLISKTIAKEFNKYLFFQLGLSHNRVKGKEILLEFLLDARDPGQIDRLVDFLKGDLSVIRKLLRMGSNFNNVNEEAGLQSDHNNPDRVENIAEYSLGAESNFAGSDHFNSNGGNFNIQIPLLNSRQSGSTRQYDRYQTMNGKQATPRRRYESAPPNDAPAKKSFFGKVFGKIGNFFGSIFGKIRNFVSNLRQSGSTRQYDGDQIRNGNQATPRRQYESASPDDAPAEKSFFGKVFSKIGNFFGSIFRKIKNFFSFGPESKEPEKINVEVLEDKLRKAYNKYKMRILHYREDDSRAQRLRQKFTALLMRKRNHAEEEAQAQKEEEAYLTPYYLEEEIGDKDYSVTLSGFVGKLKKAFHGQIKPGPADLALNFRETFSNHLIPIAGRKDFWTRLTNDIKAAKSSINVHIFGMQADDWGWEFADLLVEKAKEGVEVKIVGDKGGARMSFFNHIVGGTSIKLFDYYRKNGVDFALFESSFNPFKHDKFLHYDHRKYFVIDGRIAYNTGYTIEQHMYTKMFDSAIRAEGPIVRQMQASFFLSFFANGGSAKQTDFNAFMDKFFPLVENPGNMHANLAINVPDHQHRVTESFYQRISNARKTVYVINPYFTDNRIVNSLIQAAQNGAKVKVILPLNPENPLYSRITMSRAWQLLRKGVKIFLYKGPEQFGKLHAKGIVIDGNFVSIGSCNMDRWALYQNYEQQIESESPIFAREAENIIFKQALKHSIPYKLPEGFLKKVGGILTGKW